MLRLILVEDNPADITIFQLIMRDLGVPHSLKIFNNGEEAIKYLDDGNFLQEHKPAGIILDLNIPRKNGHELLRWIRKNSSISALPVAVLSSSSNEDDINRVEAENAVFFSKSFNLNEAKQIIRKILRLFGCNI